MKRALYIGRFQPFHLGHLKDIQEIVKKVDELIIGIGSSQYSNTKKNPFSVEERIRMIEDTLIAKGIKNYTIYPIPDIHDYPRWVEHVKTIVPDFDYVVTGSRLTTRLFKEKNIEIRKVKILKEIHSTAIRDAMLNDKDWKQFVPKQVADYLIEINGVERIKTSS